MTIIIFTGQQAFAAVVLALPVSLCPFVTETPSPVAVLPGLATYFTAPPVECVPLALKKKTPTTHA